MVMNFLRFAVTVLIGAAGGWLFSKKKIPAGLMIGSMTFVAVFNLTTGWCYFYMDLKRVVQVISGC
jgi:uncharacterized membrane protein AbrB (regulator of aidB expression)